MYRLNYYLKFDYLEEIWFHGGMNGLGEIWMKDGFPGGRERTMRVCPPKPEKAPD